RQRHRCLRRQRKRSRPGAAIHQHHNARPCAQDAEHRRNDGASSAAGLSSGSGTSGSTTWSNSFRSRLYFRRVKDRDEEPDPDVRELEVKKLNYGRIGAITQVHYFNGVFVPLEGETFSVDRSAIDLKIEEEFLQLLDRFTAQGRAVS